MPFLVLFRVPLAVFCLFWRPFQLSCSIFSPRLTPFNCCFLWSLCLFPFSLFSHKTLSPRTWIITCVLKVAPRTDACTVASPNFLGLIGYYYSHKNGATLRALRAPLLFAIYIWRRIIYMGSLEWQSKEKLSRRFNRDILLLYAYQTTRYVATMN